jgi:hypothetical protein
MRHGIVFMSHSNLSDRLTSLQTRFRYICTYTHLHHSECAIVMLYLTLVFSSFDGYACWLPCVCVYINCLNLTAALRYSRVPLEPYLCNLCRPRPSKG